MYHLEDSTLVFFLIESELKTLIFLLAFHWMRSVPQNGQPNGAEIAIAKSLFRKSDFSL